MNNRTVLVVLGGCGALLFLCVLCGVISVVLGVPTMITDALGVQNKVIEALQTPELPIPVVPTLGAIPTIGSIGKAPTAAPKATAPAAPTKAGSSSSSTGNPFADAVAKAKSATKYRMQMQMIVGGTNAGKYTEQALFDMSGDIDGTKSHLTSKGGIMAMLTGDANGAIEIITADGKTYMKGVSMFGMTDPKTWYISSDNSSTSGMENFAKPDSFTDFTGNQSNFKKTGSESVDGQSCDIWAGTLQGFDTSFLGALSGGKDTSDLSTLDKAETRVWLCGDGYVHKFTVDYQGHNGTNAAEKGAFKMNAHMWDYNNASINIQAPKDAKPMPGSKP